ncbi:ShKT domain-containing protein [Aphelenchoides bicaudatus]|nr:ShKT domain-containing protein [Aphelenchoides bicaudatus]
MAKYGRTMSESVSVLRTIPHKHEQFAYLEQLEHNATELNINFWTSPVRLLIIERERKIKKKNDFNRRFRDDVLLDEPEAETRYDFSKYGNYTTMTNWMRALARRYPNILQFISIGKSHEGRSIEGLEIGTKNKSKRAASMQESGPLASRYGRDQNITNYVNEITFVIIPCLNPDGYEFTRSSTNPNVRLWRKNRSPVRCDLDQWNRQRCCRGVDLNRNFDFHFGETGSSNDICSEIYGGQGAFSEPEARAVRDAILSNRYRSRIDGFVTLHTYSQIWIHPYGHRKDSYPGDVQDLYNVGKRATNALSKLYGTKYLLGSGADTLYPASGGSEDWAKQTGAIKYVYLLELRPDEKNWDGFILDEEQLIPTAQETWAGIKVVADAIIQRSQNKVVTPTNRQATTGSTGHLKQYRFGDGSPGSCYDIRHACKRWIQENESLCKTIPIFMREQCAYSCSFCG